MKSRYAQLLVLVLAFLAAADPGYAFQFKLSESIGGSLDTTVSTGFGLRLRDPDPNLVGDPNFSSRANTDQYSNADNGNLNYHAGNLFNTYLKINPELLMKFPDNYKFMARGTAFFDVMATDTRRTDLSSAAESQTARDLQPLDLWASKEFNIGPQSARVRVGNQVVNWGESIFAIGGINSTNAFDIQKLLTPGTQLKEAVLPAPMISFAAGLGSGVNVDMYYQFMWNKNRFPAVGSYFSTSDNLGKGNKPLFISPVNPNFGGLDATADPTLANTIMIPFLGDDEPGDQGQMGIALHYKPRGSQVDFGFYYLRYHDKGPVIESLVAGPRLVYLEDRQLFGVSANFPLGTWAVGWELSYRPDDAVSLTGPFNPGGSLDVITNGVFGVNVPQWIDKDRYQMHLTGLLSLTPGDYGRILDLLKADTATFTGEAVVIYYPGVHSNSRFVRTFDGVTVMQAPSAGYYFWKNNDTNSTLGYPITGSGGTEYSGGYTVDFSWTYDSKIIKGWQVTPGVTINHAVFGDTPNAAANYLKGNLSTNFYLLFNMNPPRWQAGINYTKWWGDTIRQPLRDRDLIGGFVSYNF
jgi:hypothetical protein